MKIFREGLSRIKNNLRYEGSVGGAAAVLCVSVAFCTAGLAV